MADSPKQLVEKTLSSAGWKDALGPMKSQGIDVKGFGDVAMQLPLEATKTLLRLEFFERRGELAFHLTDQDDVGFDLLLRPGEQLQATLQALVAIQNHVSLDTFATQVGKLVEACPDTFLLGGDGELQRITPDGQVQAIEGLEEIKAEFARAGQLAEEGKSAEALVIFEKIIELLPELEVAYANRALMLRRMGRYEQMLEASLTWARKFSDSASALMDVSIALQNLARYPESLQAIDAAMEIDPADPNLPYQKGCVLARAGRNKEALSALRKALELEPGLAVSITEDPDLAALKNDPEFGQLVGSA